MMDQGVIQHEGGTTMETTTIPVKEFGHVCRITYKHTLHYGTECKHVP
jgi:hypothetical protein